MFQRLTSAGRRAIAIMALVVGFAVVSASDRGWREAVGIGIAGVATIALVTAIMLYANRTPKDHPRA